MNIDVAEFSRLSVTELSGLYRCWPARHREREAQGREDMTFYYEGKIVRELQRRVAADEDEQMIITCCTLAYRNELDNLGFIFSLPVGEASILPEGNRSEWYLSERKASEGSWSLSELCGLIGLYSSYEDVVGRELLVEYVDVALDWIERAGDKVEPNDVGVLMALASELVELGRKGIVAIPKWLSRFLEEAVDATRKDGNVREYELVVPLLTLQLRNGSPKLEREATRIVNRCYRRAISILVKPEEIEEDIVAALYTAVTCADYVSRFSVRKVGKSWNELTTRLLPSMTQLSTQSLVRLLTVANEIEGYPYITADHNITLLEELAERAHLGDIEARCYM